MAFCSLENMGGMLSANRMDLESFGFKLIMGKGCDVWLIPDEGHDKATSVSLSKLCSRLKRSLFPPVHKLHLMGNRRDQFDLKLIIFATNS